MRCFLAIFKGEIFYANPRRIFLPKRGILLLPDYYYYYYTLTLLFVLHEARLRCYFAISPLQFSSFYSSPFPL